MSLQSKFVLDFTYEQPNYVPVDFNLGLDRSARDQEVSNCWTYPTIFSFETDLIRQGLADQNVRGSRGERQAVLIKKRGCAVGGAPRARAAASGAVAAARTSRRTSAATSSA